MKLLTKSTLGVVAVLILVVMALLVVVDRVFMTGSIFSPHAVPPAPVAEVQPGIITQAVGRALVALPMESGTGQPLILPSERMMLETKTDSVLFLLDIEIPEAIGKGEYRLELLVEAYHGVRIIPPVINPEGIGIQQVPLPLHFIEEALAEAAEWDSYNFGFGRRKTLLHHVWAFGLVVPPGHKFRVTAVTYLSEERTKSRDARMN